VTQIVQRAGTGAQYPLSLDMLTTGAERAGFLDEVTLSHAKPSGSAGRSQWWAGGPREGGLGSHAEQGDLSAFIRRSEQAYRRL